MLKSALMAVGSKVGRGWPPFAPVAGSIALELSRANSDDPALTNISAGTRIADTLFLAGDEGCAIERVLRQSDQRWGEHVRFALGDFLPLTDPDEEVDIEGLAVDDGWLWVVGSHARRRPKPRKADGGCIDLARLADLKNTRPRCLLARLPLVAEPETPGALRPVMRDGSRRAGMVKQTSKGSRLSEALAADALLSPFTRIPAKEGGVDIEGIAIAGDRLALGMRGPVISSFALLIEATIDARPSGKLRLAEKPIKRLLDLEGLGIRDLKRSGDDLLILAGPTTGLDGPCALYRWRGWVLDAGQDASEVELHHPERLFDIPFGRGVDHPEGLALWEGEPSRILVLYDSPAKERCDMKNKTVLADIFDLPS